MTRVKNQLHATILVTGIVQGVGFRPFVYRIAKRHQLRGFFLAFLLSLLMVSEIVMKRLERFLVNRISAQQGGEYCYEVKGEKQPPQSEPAGKYCERYQNEAP